MDKGVSAFLQVDRLVAGYDERPVLHGVSLEVRASEVVALIGHNGSGKSTLLKAVFGLLPYRDGEVRIEGLEKYSDPVGLLRAGVAYVPQGNNVFGTMTVRENLEIGCIALRATRSVGEGVDVALSLFPKLEKRLGVLARNLSGGERQMLALGRALAGRPRLLLLDEPSLGLAPPLVGDVLARILELSEKFDVAVLVVEQKVRQVLQISERCYVLRNGVVTYSGPADVVSDSEKLREVYL